MDALLDSSSSRDFEGRPIAAYYSKLLECFTDGSWSFPGCEDLQILCLLDRIKAVNALFVGAARKGPPIKDTNFRALTAYFVQQLLQPSKTARRWPMLGGRHEDLKDFYDKRTLTPFKVGKPIPKKIKTWLSEHVSEEEAAKAINDHSPFGILMILHRLQQMWNDSRLEKLISKESKGIKSRCASNLIEASKFIEAVKSNEANALNDIGPERIIDIRDLPTLEETTTGKEMVDMGDGTGFYVL